MRVHFIAIGGSAMHNLAIALHKKRFQITGSDDEIFEPSYSRLKKYDLLPEKTGWDAGKITHDLDAVILGMHARMENPELKRARELKLKVYSYPEFIYNQVKNKKRIVIGGSHGKTTITSMIMHVLKFLDYDFDYLVGANIKGFETMVGLSDHAKLAVLEGDEYLSSVLDKRPKFHLYHPHIAVITGIHWDHINVFPTFEEYVRQFREFIELIEFKGALVYYRHDEIIDKLFPEEREDLYYWPYEKHPGVTRDGISYLKNAEALIRIGLFGDHNLENIAAAQKVCRLLGIKDADFYEAVSSFEGAARRLEKIAGDRSYSVFYDYAHSPSKVSATIKAVKSRFPDKPLIACLELHTFSSLNKSFLSEYHDSMKEADEKVVFYSPETIKQKNLENITKADIRHSFNEPELEVLSSKEALDAFLDDLSPKDKVILFMSSGNFAGVDIKSRIQKIH